MGLFGSGLGTVLGGAGGFAVGGPLGMGVGAALGGAVDGMAASQSAAQIQTQASQDATAAQLGMFNVQQANEKPYLQAGATDLQTIQDNMGAWNTAPTSAQTLMYQDPGYQFQLAQGPQGIDASAAASNGLVNAGTMASLSNYSQNQASNEYANSYGRYQQQINNSYNRLMGVAGLGNQAATGVNSAAQNAGNNISSNIIGAGNAQAAGQMGVANAASGAVGQGLNAYNNNQWMNRIYPQGGGGGGTNSPADVSGMSGSGQPGFQTDSMGNVSGLGN